jgi:hypothetical protein
VEVELQVPGEQPEAAAEVGMELEPLRACEQLGQVAEVVAEQDSGVMPVVRPHQRSFSDRDS